MRSVPIVLETNGLDREARRFSSITYNRQFHEKPPVYQVFIEHMKCLHLSELHHTNMSYPLTVDHIDKYTMFSIKNEGRLYVYFCNKPMFYS